MERRNARDEELYRWSEEHRVDVERLDEGQRWVVFAALRVLTVIGKLKPLRRIFGYFLAHSGMGLGSTLIGALIGVTDRAVRQTREHSAKQMLKSIRNPTRGRPKAKLGPEHAGLVAKYLATHSKPTVAQILEFIATELGVTMDRLTLRRYIKRYGLGCLRGETHERAPFLSARPTTAAPSC